MNKQEIDKDFVSLIIELKKNGISNVDVLNAIESFPRKNFLEKNIHSKSNLNIALPIECGQTISQPLIVAYMTQALQLNKKLKVLEIGTGSGYQTSILSMLARFVYTVERFKSLKENSDKVFKSLNITNVFTKHADGGLGWVEQAPFDRILVTASAPEVPRTLINQLSNNGIMVIPIGEENNNQTLTIFKKVDDIMYREELMEVRFVPLLKGKKNHENNILFIVIIIK